jgi:hypothetical protein
VIVSAANKGIWPHGAMNKTHRGVRIGRKAFAKPGAAPSFQAPLGIQDVKTGTKPPELLRSSTKSDLDPNLNFQARN